MGSEFTGAMRSHDKLKKGNSITYGINGNGGSKSNLVSGPKTTYKDRVSKSTVKRAS